MNKKFVLTFFFFIFQLTAYAEESLKTVYDKHFLMGTIWHGTKTPGGRDSKHYSPEGNQENIFLPLEKYLTVEQFNSITPENCMKPAFIQPKENVFTFDETDRMMDFAEANKLEVVGHTLVWKNATPSWFFVDAKGNKVSREVLIGRLKKHIRTVVGRYKGRVKYWDVVNEAVHVERIKGANKSVGIYRDSGWLDIIGPEYIEIAYRTANEVDPDAILLYNDFDLDKPSKLDFIISMIKDLRNKGVPVHGLGYQGHLFLDEPKLSSIERVIQKAKEAKIPLHITELDVSVLPNAWKHRAASVEDNFKLAAKFNPYHNKIPSKVLKAQAQRYKEIFDIFIKYSDVIERVTFWGVWDGNSWRNYKPMRGRTDYPLLFGRDFDYKPAYHSVIKIAKDNN